MYDSVTMEATTNIYIKSEDYLSTIDEKEMMCLTHQLLYGWNESTHEDLYARIDIYNAMVNCSNLLTITYVRVPSFNDAFVQTYVQLIELIDRYLEYSDASTIDRLHLVRRVMLSHMNAAPRDLFYRQGLSPVDQLINYIEAILTDDEINLFSSEITQDTNIPITFQSSEIYAMP